MIDYTYIFIHSVLGNGLQELLKMLPRIPHFCRSKCFLMIYYKNPKWKNDVDQISDTLMYANGYGTNKIIGNLSDYTGWIFYFE